MPEQTYAAAAFWDDLERRIASTAESALETNDAGRALIVSYLREVETMARRNCARRQTVQIVASARRLLGDKTEIGSKDGPFACSARAGR